MLQVIHAGTKTHVKHDDPVLSANVKVPNRREAIEALGIVEKLTKERCASVMIDGEVITVESAFDVLRRFVLTR